MANTSFMDSLRVKIDCKVMLIHNIDTSNGLTNGQLGKLIDIIKTEDGSAAKLIIEFQKENVGKQKRKKHPKFSEQYPIGTVIEKVSFTLKKGNNWVDKSNSDSISFESCICNNSTQDPRPDYSQTFKGCIGHFFCL